MRYILALALCLALMTGVSASSSGENGLKPFERLLDYNFLCNRPEASAYFHLERDRYGGRYIELLQAAVGEQKYIISTCAIFMYYAEYTPANKPMYRESLELLERSYASYYTVTGQDMVTDFHVDMLVYAILCSYRLGYYEKAKIYKETLQRIFAFDPDSERLCFPAMSDEDLAIYHRVGVY